MQTDKGSFRDCSGSIFYENGDVYRVVNPSFLPDYRALMESGLYEELVQKKLLIPHVETNQEPLILCPEKIPFISYPNEWCFAQLKQAALVTLEAQSIASKYDMHLKDASVYNVQFYEGKAILIDTLSFERKKKPIPWIAYRQFCQHFLAPLALVGKLDWRLKSLFLTHIDGIPLDLTVQLLPKTQFFKPSLFLHLFLHSKFQSKKSSSTTSQVKTSSKLAEEGLISSLTSAVKRMDWKRPKTLWQNYGQEDSYSAKSFQAKEVLVKSYLSHTRPNTVWDIGSNDGHYSQIASRFAKHVIAFDGDPICIERLFENQSSILPLIMDFSVPTPSYGWGGSERKSLAERGPTDLLMALALIHHLRVTAGIPFHQIAEYFSRLTEHLIIEFIPANDRKFLQMKEGTLFDSSTYTEDLFLQEFSSYFEIIRRDKIEDSERVLFLMKQIRK